MDDVKAQVKLLINKTQVRKWFRGNYRSVSDDALNDLNEQMIAACRKTIRMQQRIERLKVKRVMNQAAAAAQKALFPEKPEETGEVVQ